MPNPHHVKFKTKFNYCSNGCRVQIYRKARERKEILEGRYHHMNVNTLERLGFEVTVK
jgi:hypothetical protein